MFIRSKRFQTDITTRTGDLCRLSHWWQSPDGLSRRFVFQNDLIHHKTCTYKCKRFFLSKHFFKIQTTRDCAVMHSINIKSVQNSDYTFKYEGHNFTIKFKMYMILLWEFIRLGFDQSASRTLYLTDEPLH